MASFMAGEIFLFNEIEETFQFPQLSEKIFSAKPLKNSVVLERKKPLSRVMWEYSY